MTQTIRPNTDISRTNWSLVGAASAWDCINDDPDSSDGETSYVVSSTVGATFEVALTDPTAPVVHCDHEIKYRVRGTVNGFGIKVTLVQGAGLAAVILATRLFSPRVTYQNDSFSVPIDVADDITDYSDLRLRFELTGSPGSGELRVTAAEVTLPDASLTDVDARSFSRISVAALSSINPIAMTRTVASVLMAGTTFVRTSRVVGSALLPAPISPAMTRVTVGVLSENPQVAVVRGTRVSAAVLSANPLQSLVRATRVVGSVLAANPLGAVARLTRAAASALTVNPSTDTRRMSRMVASILTSRTGTETTTPADLPATMPSILIANWARPLGLETAWQTDVQTTPSTGAEERYSLASRPKRSIDFITTALGAREVGDALLSAARHGQNRVAVPLHVDKVKLTSWNGTTWLGDFSNRRFAVGARAFVWRVGEGGRTSDVQIGVVQTRSDSQITVVGATLSSSDPGPFRVTPAIDVEINLEIAAGLASAEAGEVQYRLDELSGAGAIPAAANGLPAGFSTYQGMPILDVDDAIDSSQRVQISLLRDGESRGMGRDQVATPAGPRPRWYFGATLQFQRRDEFWSVLEFFDSRRGRAAPFWAVVPGAPFGFVSQAGTTLTVSATGNVLNALAFVSAIGVVMRNGTRHIRRVTNIQQAGANWNFTIEESLGALNSADVLRVSVAFVARFNSDGLEERWLGDGEGVRSQIGVVELLADGPVDITPQVQGPVTGVPDGIPDMVAWFDSGINVYSWLVGSSWIKSAPFPTADLGANQPGWLVQRWVDTRRNGTAEPLEHPVLEAALGAISSGGSGQVSGFDKQRVSVETCKTTGGGLSRFIPRLGDSNPWSNAAGKGFTAVFVGAQPHAVFLDLRNGAGAPLVYWDVASFQLFAVPGFTDPTRAALYALTPPAGPGIPMTIAARWTPGGTAQVVQGGVVLSTASVALAAIASDQYDPAQSVVMHGVTTAPAGNPVSAPLKLSGIGLASRNLALLIYARRLSNSELNTLGAYFRDRFGSPWVTL